MYEVLLIEDDVDIRESTIEFLEMEGFSAVGCINGRDAMEHLQSTRDSLPKLILVDLNMPVLDGIGFREAQMSDRDFRDIPCAIMSADSAIASKCKELGITEIVKKPVDLDKLVALVKRFAPK